MLKSVNGAFGALMKKGETSGKINGEVRETIILFPSASSLKVMEVTINNVFVGLLSNEIISQNYEISHIRKDLQK